VSEHERQLVKSVFRTALTMSYGERIAHLDQALAARPELRREMMNKSGRRTVPQIWIGERHVGGYDDLARLEQQGKLDEILELA